MKKLKKKKELSRDRDQRKALFKTMLGSLIMQEKITTTEIKAKELKKKIDRIINKAKLSQQEEKKVAVIRDIKKTIPEKAVKKITGEFLKKFEKRVSGYTRVVKLSPRKSDYARMAIIEFV